MCTFRLKRNRLISPSENFYFIRRCKLIDMKFPTYSDSTKFYKAGKAIQLTVLQTKVRASIPAEDAEYFAYYIDIEFKYKYFYM